MLIVKSLLLGISSFDLDSSRYLCVNTIFWGEKKSTENLSLAIFSKFVFSWCFIRLWCYYHYKYRILCSVILYESEQTNCTATFNFLWRIQLRGDMITEFSYFRFPISFLCNNVWWAKMKECSCWWLRLYRSRKGTLMPHSWQICGSLKPLLFNT